MTQSFMDGPEDVKTTNDCVELATVDAYGEYEQAEGWLACMDEVFGNVKKVKLLGEEAEFKGFDLVNDTQVVAVCKKKNKKIKVTLDSVEFLKLTKVQSLWLKALLKWQKEGDS